MKIAIIGGGFYGCCIAYKLLYQFPKIQISLFEKNLKLLAETAINNQYRLHQGFHYPRSFKTIKQTNDGFKKFYKEFKKFVYFPKKNYYLIHRGSKVSFVNYTAIYKKFDFKFEKLQIKKIPFLRNSDNYLGAIKVFEGVIKLSKLYDYLKKKLFSNNRINFFLNREILKIDKKNGFIFSKKKDGPFDLIINTSFTDLNLGLKKKFKVKYELASIVQIENCFDSDFALTIMDGNYISIYPINKKITTLSSVKYTPVRKFNNIFLLKKFLKNKNLNNILVKNSKKIINDVKKYVNLDKIKINKITIAPKVKLLKDINDDREVLVKKESKIISILCGKIDAVYIAWEKIKREVEKDYY
jgi:hypothetical protein